MMYRLNEGKLKMMPIVLFELASFFVDNIDLLSFI